MAFKIDFKSIKYHSGLRNPAAWGKTKNLSLPEILKMGLSDRRNGVTFVNEGVQNHLKSK